ncbi:hypothetical protein HZA86_05700 [Candidatus Uhrbacteria bacterium]|nr:hypothetical protein [Candidatus Uhrbacteria bacterium]
MPGNAPPSNPALSNLSPSAVKQGYDNYRAGQGLSPPDHDSQAGGQAAEQSRLGRSMGYARELNQLRQGGLKGAARKGLKHLVGGKEGGQIEAAITSDTSNFVFSICLVAAIIKDSIDLGSDGVLALFGAGTEAIFGSLSVLVSWIPFVGQFLAAGVQIIPIGLGGGAWGGIFITKLIMMFTIWALLGWKMRAFRTGARQALKMFFWVFQWIMGFVAVVDVVPVVDIIPFETLAVGFGWMATLLLARTEEETKKEKKSSGGVSNLRPDAVKQGYERYRAQQEAQTAHG